MKAIFDVFDYFLAEKAFKWTTFASMWARLQQSVPE